MDNIIFYEPYFKSKNNDINEIFECKDIKLSENVKLHLSEKELELMISLLKEINIKDIDYLVIHNIGCTKRIVYKNIQECKKIAHIFLTQYYVHDLIQKRKEQMITYDNLFKVIGLGILFGAFSYFKN